MIIKGLDILKIQIIDLKDSSNIGYIDDFVFNPKSRKIEAYLVKLKDQEEYKVLHLPDAKNITKDSITIDGKEILKNISEVTPEIAEIISNKVQTTYLSKTKAITTEGTELGMIRDILFDSHSGFVSNIEISSGIKDLIVGKKYIPVNAILKVGEDTTIISQSEIDKPIKVEDSEKPENIENKKELTPIPKLQKNFSTDIIKNTHKDMNNIVGMYITKNILDKEDNIIAPRGSLITHALLKEAQDLGVIEEIKTFSQIEPIIEKQTHGQILIKNNA